MASKYYAVHRDLSCKEYTTLDFAIVAKGIYIIEEKQQFYFSRLDGYIYKVFDLNSNEIKINDRNWEINSIYGEKVFGYIRSQIADPLGEIQEKEFKVGRIKGVITLIKFLYKVADFENWKQYHLKEENERLIEENKKLNESIKKLDKNE